MLTDYDPRLKLLLAISISYASIAVNGSKFLLIYYLLIILLFLAIKDIKGAIAILKYALVVFILNYFAKYYFATSIGNFTIIIVFFISKLSVFGIMLYWLQSNMKTGHFVAALQSIKIPKGIIITIAVILRFIPTLHCEIKEIKNAMKLRGIQVSLKNMVTKPYSTIKYGSIPLLLRSMTISDQLSASAMTRGLDLETKRTSYIELKMHLFEVVFTILILFIIFTIYYLSKVSTKGAI